ncbi:MAG: IS1595 family transposase [Candidatus Deferrimicrobium sp.]
MKSRWKHDRPMSRTDFDRRFPDEGACARHLANLRWPDGFICPACGTCKGWELETKPFTWECAGCHRQTSVTAGTVMHRSKLPLRIWFEAVHLMTGHSNGISAEQAQAQLGIRSYKTAWLLLHKLRRAMVDPNRSFLQGLVEVDESEVPLRSKHDPIANHGIPNVGILQIIGAVELDEEGRPCRVRLEPLVDRTGPSVRGFVERNVAVGATVISDGFAGYRKLAEHRTHVGKVVGNMAAHVLLPWVHRAFSNLKRWFGGTLHGVRKQHLRRYLDEFTFRWNRRRHTRTAFDKLLDLTTRLPHASMQDFVKQRV